MNLIMECKDCQYFFQHYVSRKKDCYVSVHCGHCVYPFIKHRKPDSPAWKNFEQKKPRRRILRGVKMY